VDSIVAALDKFGDYYPNYRLGATKGDILESHLAALPQKPKVALEVGTFWGYSAIRTARHLADGGKMFCIEYNANNAEVANNIIKYAGLDDRIKIFVGKSSWELPKIANEVGRADFVLLDHNKKLYLPDLQLMEQLGIVSDDTQIAADNVIYPGAPDFLNYVQTSSTYDTHLVEAAHEVNLDAADPRGVFRGAYNVCETKSTNKCA